MKIDLPTLQHFFSLAPHIVDLGVVPVACEEGVVKTELVVQPKHRQHAGLVHAGVMGSMADHTMGAAAQTLAPEGQLVLTAELKLSMLRTASGERIECEARVIKPGRSISFTEAEVWAVDGDRRTLVLKASATMALTPMPAGLGKI